MSDPSEKLAKYMLQGWCMLENACDKCDIPLMRSKDGKQKICVVCNDPSARPAAAAASSSSSSSGASSSSAAAPSKAPQQQLPKLMDLDPDFDEEQDYEFYPSKPSAAFTQRSEDRDRQSAEMSQLMLKGWSMLAENCPADTCAVPLMYNKKDHSSYCVSCKRTRGMAQLERILDGDEEDVPLPASAASGVAPAAPAAPAIQKEKEPEQPKPVAAPVAAPAPVKKERSYTQDMAEKMLQGWTMLQQTCPNPACIAPLLRNKKGEMYCAQCKCFAISEKDYDPSKHRIAPPTPAVAPIAPAPVTPAPVAAVATQVPAPMAVESSGDKRKAPATVSDDESVSKMGRLLLQGWTMLEQTCPRGCAVPLMQKRGSNIAICSACDRQIEIINIPASAAPAASGAAASRYEADEDYYGYGEDDEYDVAMEEEEEEEQQAQPLSSARPSERRSGAQGAVPAPAPAAAAASSSSAQSQISSIHEDIKLTLKRVQLNLAQAMEQMSESILQEASCGPSPAIGDLPSRIRAVGEVLLHCEQSVFSKFQ